MLEFFQPILFLTTLFYFFNTILGQNDYPVYVNTTRGPLLGYHFDQGNDTSQTWYGQADIFLGIPFALKPMGELRYKKPRPLLTYPGPSPYNATYYRDACIQPNRTSMKAPTSEDCLYVNIFTPNASSTTKYPVMIYIHGGGLITGTGDLWINGVVRNLVSKGIVVASLQYRMGWLGFFTTFTDDFPPNLGMLDQLLALKFLKEELPYFGGDPNRITLFGHSAGSHSVSSHTYSPLSQNLFQQTIQESGAVLTCYEDSVGPTNRNFLLAQYACNYTQEMWDSKNFTALKDCLMKISAEEGLAAANKAGARNAVCWNMVQDNYFMPDIPQNLYKKRPNKPVIIGNCKDEGASLEIGHVEKNPNLTEYTRASMEARIARDFASFIGNQSQAIIKIFEDNYLKPGTADDDHMAWLQFIVDVTTPAFFTWGSLRDVEYYLLNKNPDVYTYHFVWSSSVNDEGNPLPNWHPALHGCELTYVMGYEGTWNATDQAIGNLISGAWANFARYGKPTLDDTWKPTTSSNNTALEYFEFNQNSAMKTGFRAADQVVWNQAIPQVLGDSPPNLPDNYPICTYGYQSKVKSTTCYGAFDTPLAWNEAQTACVQGTFGNLASIGNAFENSDLLAYAKGAYPSCSGFYIGLFKNVYTQDARWTWANYDPSLYTNWRSGSPNIAPNNNCVVLNANDGTWTNQDCSMPQCYICSYI